MTVSYRTLDSLDGRMSIVRTPEKSSTWSAWCLRRSIKSRIEFPWGFDMLNVAAFDVRIRLGVFLYCLVL